MKQTAVDWLIVQIKNDYLNKALRGWEWMKIFQQAKELERQQIESAYRSGNIYATYGFPEKPSAEEYYNKNYTE